MLKLAQRRGRPGPAPWAWLAGLALALCLAGPAPAQTPGMTPEAPLELVFPQLRGMAPPAWVKPGLRLTYYTAAATVPGGSHYFYRDEQGIYVGQNPDDLGQRYSVGEQHGGGGHGFLQVDLAAMEQGLAALNLGVWLLESTHKQILPVAAVGVLGLASSGTGFWLPPAFLASLPETRQDGLTITRFPHTVAGRAYQALRIEHRHKKGVQASAYDLASGVLIYNRSETKSPEQPHTWGGEATGLAQAHFLGMRQRDLPWSQAAPPAWTQRARRLSGDGASAYSQPGVARHVMPLQFRMDIIARGQGWLGLDLDIEQRLAPQAPASNLKARLISGLAQTGGVFIPPGGLAGLRPGQALDQDDITKVSLSVAASPPGQVAILETGQTHRVTLVYDLASGGLLSLDRQQNMGWGQVDTQLNIRRMD